MGKTKEGSELMNLRLITSDTKHVACEKYYFGLCAMRGYRLCRMHECEKYVLLPEAKWLERHNERMERFMGRGILGLLGGGMRK